MTRARLIGPMVMLLLVATAPVLAGSAERAFQVRLGGFFPDADSDQWKANERLFTQDESDFNEGVLGLSYVVGFDNHLEFGLNLDFYDSTVLSADRDFVDDFGNPIFHDTVLDVIPMTVDLRFLPGGRYRERGRRQVLQPVPYVGAGIGLSFWEYEEVGDFVDVDDPLGPSVFFDRYKDSGVALELHALAGVEFPVSRSFNLLLEGRYSWSEAEPNQSYALEFGETESRELDLGGASFFVGGAWRF